MEANHVLRIGEVVERVGLSRSMIYLMVSDGRLPPPIKLSSRAVGWPADEITAWIEQRKTARGDGGQR